MRSARNVEIMNLLSLPVQRVIVMLYYLRTVPTEEDISLATTY